MSPHFLSISAEKNEGEPLQTDTTISTNDGPIVLGDDGDLSKSKSSHVLKDHKN